MPSRGGYLNRLLARHYGRPKRASQQRLIQRAAEQGFDRPLARRIKQLEAG